jgi:hypothetical protein
MSERIAQVRLNIPAELYPAFQRFCERNLYTEASTAPYLALLRAALVAEEKAHKEEK